MLRGRPEHRIMETFSKVYSPQRNDKSGDNIFFTHTHNVSQSFVRRRIADTVKNDKGDSMKKAFGKCRVIVGTRQPKSLRKYLIRSKFSRSKKKVTQTIPGLYACRKNCKYHRLMGIFDHVRNSFLVRITSSIGNTDVASHVPLGMSFTSSNAGIVGVFILVRLLI